MQFSYLCCYFQYRVWGTKTSTLVLSLQAREAISIIGSFTSFRMTRGVNTLLKKFIIFNFGNKLTDKLKELKFGKTDINKIREGDFQSL